MTPQGETCGCRDGFILDTDLKSCKQDLSWTAPRYNTSASKWFIRRFVITEKAPTRAFSVITNLRMHFGCNFLKH